MNRPERDEYAGYYHQYVGRVPDGNVVDFLESQRDEFVSLLEGIDPDRGDYRYAEGKWSIKDVVGHIIDTERVFGYRAVAFARGDRSTLPGFEQDEYVARANFADRTLGDLVAEFRHHRTSLVILFRSFDRDIWTRRGTASGFEFTTRAVAFILAGHVMHHQAVLLERYLSPGDGK